MEKEKLDEILKQHAIWLRTRFNVETKGMCADLRGVDLRCVNLSDADLSDANLRRADLRRADLGGANLGGADLSDANLGDANLGGANLGGADLSDADLSDANLRRADLRRANLRRANLRRANLSDANLGGANLGGADLSDANLSDANLGGADLSGADLSGADLSDANLSGADYNNTTSFFALQCPEKGSFIGYKVAQGLIIELLITEDAQRSSATTRKCRCSKAKVICITNKDGSCADCNSVRSDRDSRFIYRVGETVEVLDYDENRWNECSSGIHFSITREEAVKYNG